MGNDWDLEYVIFTWVRNHQLINITYGQIQDLRILISANYELDKVKREVEKQGRSFESNQ